MTKTEQDGCQCADLKSDAVWTVTPLDLGTRYAHWAWFNYLDTTREPLKITYRVWLLRSGSDFVLVDTGPPLEESKKRGISDMASVKEKLNEAGISVGEVKHVILTHLHWDHASSADIYESAKFYVQQDEINFFLGDAWRNEATARFFSHKEMLASLINSNQIVPIKEDILLKPGLRLIKVGGHTPGSQIVVVKTKNGVEVLTGDAIPMNRNYTNAIPTGILVDLHQVLEARRLVHSLHPYCIYTGHDPISRYVCNGKEL